ncbi:MAG: hypothetical protein KIS86_00740 [Devosia sp.]|nr:hypothetical protein [Devosia sp.]
MNLIWLRCGEEFAVTPLNCLYSACRGLLIDGHDPDLCQPPDVPWANYGFFSHEDDEAIIHALSAGIERVTPSPAGRYLDPRVTLDVAKDHHKGGVAHVWLAPC